MNKKERVVGKQAADCIRKEKTKLYKKLKDENGLHFSMDNDYPWIKFRILVYENFKT
jgi:hypothetical protein